MTKTASFTAFFRSIAAILIVFVAISGLQLTNPMGLQTTPSASADTTTTEEQLVTLEHGSSTDTHHLLQAHLSQGLINEPEISLYQEGQEEAIETKELNGEESSVEFSVAISDVTENYYAQVGDVKSSVITIAPIEGEVAPEPENNIWNIVVTSEANSKASRAELYSTIMDTSSLIQQAMELTICQS